jgi:tRNA(Ile)-lysidine synthase
MRRSAADSDDTLEAAFARALKALGFCSDQISTVAVSGGSDSVALMHLLTGWSREMRAPPPVVLTVNHGLRADSRRDAIRVANWAEELGLKAAVLTWDGQKPAAGIEEHARNARYSLLGNWCTSRQISNLFVGHTRDDQVETFLLRLARGSGIDGLAAMAPRASLPLRQYSSVQLLRPLLDFGRDTLRGYLRQRGIAWLEDPMNADHAHARVRIRQLVPAMAAAGLTAERVAVATKHIARARSALESGTLVFLQQHVVFNERSPEALLDASAFRQLPKELALRALSELLLRVGGATYRPRFGRLERLYRAIADSGLRGQTLSGCRVAPAPRSRQRFGVHTIRVWPETGRATVRRA